MVSDRVQLVQMVLTDANVIPAEERIIIGEGKIYLRQKLKK